MSSTNCPKCGSSEEIPDVRIIDHGEGNVALDLSATVYRKPEAMLFKGALSHSFRARVCGACGYTEFYVSNPGTLLAAARKASATKTSKAPKRAKSGG